MDRLAWKRGRGEYKAGKYSIVRKKPLWECWYGKALISKSCATLADAQTVCETHYKKHTKQ